MSGPLFVYGTLRDPDVLAFVLGRRLPPESAMPATAPDHRAVYFPGRSYPALRPAPTAGAEGLLLDGLTGTDFRLLDLFEGDEYARGPIDVIVTGQARAAQVYWPTGPVPETAAAWSLGDWVARHKAAFLAAEADSLDDLRRQLGALPPGAS